MIDLVKKELLFAVLFHKEILFNTFITVYFIQSTVWLLGGGKGGSDDLIIRNKIFIHLIIKNWNIPILNIKLLIISSSKISPLKASMV